jgi:HlyD family secretion protein
MRRTIVAVLLVAFALAVVGFVGYGDEKTRQDDDKLNNHVAVAAVPASIRTFVKAMGTVNAVVMVEVGSQLSGQISEVLVDFNDPVKAGQVIARINPETFIAAVNMAKADFKIATANEQLQKAALQQARVAVDSSRTAREVAVAQLTAAQSQQDGNEREYQRYRGLNDLKSVAEQTFAQARTTRDMGAANLLALQGQVTMKTEAIETAGAQLAMAEANYANAQAVVEQKQAALDQAQVDLQRTEIRSPIDGVVIKRVINPGQTVAVSLESKTLFKIANDLGEMQVYGKIDEADVGQVKVGQLATFTVDAYPNKVFSGHVLQVRKSPEISQSVVTYTAVVSAPNPDQLLLPGMTARLQVVVGNTEDAPKIRNPALSFRPSPDLLDRMQNKALDAKSKVWAVNADGNAIPVEVTLGKNDETGTAASEDRPSDQTGDVASSVKPHG